MHATAIASWPPTLFWLPESVKTMHASWALRQTGVPVYFTMDAGRNIKLLARRNTLHDINKHLPSIEWIAPFE